MWKHIPYSELPSWLKKDWHISNNRIGKKLVKVHHSENISYKILYTRDRRGRIHTKCWKRYNTRIPRKTTNNGLVAVGILVFCFLGFVMVSQTNIVTDLFQEINRNIIPQIETGFPVITSSSDPYTGKYNVGTIATENSGTKGMAIVSNNYQGQYLVKNVFLESSGKGWYTKGSIEAQWVSYDEVEVKYPIKWGGGIMDTSHIPDRDWTITSQIPEKDRITTPQSTVQIKKEVSYSTSDNSQISGSFTSKEKAREIIAYINSLRQSQGVNPLRFDDRVYNLALARTQDMVRYHYMDHVNPTTGACPDNMKLQYGFNSNEYLAENAYGGPGGYYGNIEKDALNIWMGSRGHHYNLFYPHSAGALVCSNGYCVFLGLNNDRFGEGCYTGAEGMAYWNSVGN